MKRTNYNKFIDKYVKIHFNHITFYNDTIDDDYRTVFMKLDNVDVHKHLDNEVEAEVYGKGFTRSTSSYYENGEKKIGSYTYILRTDMNFLIKPDDKGTIEVISKEEFEKEFETAMNTVKASFEI